MEVASPEYVPVAKRRSMEVENFLRRKRSKTTTTTVASHPSPSSTSISKPPSLLTKSIQLSVAAAEPKIEADQQQEIENLPDRKTLLSVTELAKGITYSEPLYTGWKPPLGVRRLSVKEREAIRKRSRIVAEGEEIPPPVTTFEDMRFPEPILKTLREKLGFAPRPTPIQIQGIPVILSGRDMIGISSTGSGKTLVFVLPLIMAALQEERMMPLVRGEGPFGLVLCPSRELAIQTYELVQQFLAPFGSLRSLLCIGGREMGPQLEMAKKGVHIVVATPGRLKDLLAKKKLNMDVCKYVALDEADRLLDSGFEDDVRFVFDHFKAQRQTVLFSATMPARVQHFAKTSLVKPVVVNTGATNLDVIHEVEYVKKEEKFVNLLECLQKTAPPVLVFSEKKSEVAEIHEYLLAKGIEAASVHGDMDQKSREEAIASFRAGEKDVLVATDVSSKGLDFPDIQHVINYDMPKEIENYVHRIGRTGRRGKTGIATTFINSKDQNETVLLDLKHLLQEAKQRVPPFLAMLDDDQSHLEFGSSKGCSNCGGLGHRIIDCPKQEQQRKRLLAESRRDYFGSGGYRGEI
ncbi:DEAD-box ATP-dependent RNA helicase 35 [Linum grandiflorum]